jgi:hypothetical protein
MKRTQKPLAQLDTGTVGPKGRARVDGEQASLAAVSL